MDEIVRHQRPAPVVYGPRVRSLDSMAVMSRRSRSELLSAVRLKMRRGELESVHGDTLRIENGLWTVDVRLMPLESVRPRPRWARAAIFLAIGGASLGALFALGWWALSTLAVLPSAFLLIFIAVGMLASAHRATRPNVTVIQQSRVDVR